MSQGAGHPWVYFFWAWSIPCPRFGTFSYRSSHSLQHLPFLPEEYSPTGLSPSSLLMLASPTALLHRTAPQEKSSQHPWKRKGCFLLLFPFLLFLFSCLVHTSSFPSAGSPPCHISWLRHTGVESCRGGKVCSHVPSLTHDIWGGT